MTIFLGIMWRGFLAWAKQIPLRVWLVLGTVIALFAIVVYHVHAVDSAEERGYQRALNNARFDSAKVAMVDSIRARAKGRTDTIVRVVRAKAARVDSQAIRMAALAAQIPAVLDSIPEVKELRALAVEHAAETRSLVDSIGALHVKLDEERAATKVSLDLRDGMVRDARLENARLAAENAALMKRPTRTQQVATGIVSFAAGVGLPYAVKAVKR